MYRLFILLIAAGCWSACSSPATNDNGIINAKAKTRLDSTLKAQVDSGYVAGVSALIFEKNKEVYFKAFGLADVENKVPMDRNTIVRIYSMTKPITGTALMSLYEKGAFQLDDPLSKYLPEYKNVKVFTGYDAKGNMILEEPRRPITIRDITRHTAGFVNNQPDTTTRLGMLVKKTNPMDFENTLAQMSEKLASLPLVFHPGEQWSYGMSVDVQAALVERLAKKPFEQYINETILDPLKMNTTRYVVAEGDLNRFAAVYRQGDDKKLSRVPDADINKFNSKPWSLTPGGFGLTSTVDDYMKFAQMLVNEGTLDNATILKGETVQLMATNQLADSVTERMWLPDKGRVGFGIDFAVRTSEAAGPQENRGEVGEFFWDGAASTLFWVDPKNELTAVLFVQVFPFSRRLHKDFRDAVYGPFWMID